MPFGFSSSISTTSSSSSLPSKCITRATRETLIRIHLLILIYVSWMENISIIIIFSIRLLYRCVIFLYDRLVSKRHSMIACGYLGVVLNWTIKLLNLHRALALSSLDCPLLFHHVVHFLCHDFLSIDMVALPSTSKDAPETTEKQYDEHYYGNA